LGLACHLLLHKIVCLHNPPLRQSYQNTHSANLQDVADKYCLEKIKRIERGIIYHFDRSVTDKKAVLSAIMDKMTESELCSIDEAHSIFDDFKPRPFAHVDILSKGKSALEHANTTFRVQCVLFFPARINVEYHLPWTTKARLCQGVA
jgi:hypothetical protein